MAKFTDKLNREWTLDINVAAMRRAKKQGVDLSMPVPQFQSFMMDDVFLADALFAIIEPDAKAKGITLEQFETGLDGKVAEAAREALWDSLCEYFDSGKAEMLRATVASVRSEIASVTTSLTSSGLTDFKGSLVSTLDSTD